MKKTVCEPVIVLPVHIEDAHLSAPLFRDAFRYDILYFYSDRRYINLVTALKTYTFYGKLNDIEGQIQKNFIRIHQRCLVNSDKVTFLGNDNVPVDNPACKKLPVSRAYRKEASGKLAKALLAEFL